MCPFPVSTVNCSTVKQWGCRNAPVSWGTVISSSGTSSILRDSFSPLPSSCLFIEKSNACWGCSLTYFQYCLKTIPKDKINEIACTLTLNCSCSKGNKAPPVIDSFLCPTWKSLCMFPSSCFILQHVLISETWLHSSKDRPWWKHYFIYLWHRQQA